jgi:uncharacterized protein (UPF0335 family)
MNDMTAGIGDNSVAADELKLLIERVERLTEKRKGINDDIKDVYAEAKSRGYDPKTMRVIVRERAKRRDVLAEEFALLATYRAALDMLEG